MYRHTGNLSQSTTNLSVNINEITMKRKQLVSPPSRAYTANQDLCEIVYTASEINNNISIIVGITKSRILS